MTTDPGLPVRFRGAVSLLFAWGICAGAVGAEESATRLSFALRGEAQAAEPVSFLFEYLEPAEVEVHEPYEDRRVRFRAFPLADVLDVVYGPAWRQEEEFLLTCSDGYQPGFPVQRALQHRAWLAFERVGDPDFTIQKLESGKRRKVSLGPFYLIWENLDDPVILQEGDYGWPYQLVGVDLVRARDRFPKMTPPAGASAEVQAGYAGFRVHCSRCHTVNGEGGAIGPELNSPVNPFDHRSRAWLRAWIDDPAKLQPGARMPAFNRALPERAARIDEILTYLAAMRGQRLGKESASAPAPEAGVGDG